MSKYTWSLFGGTKIAEIHKKTKDKNSESKKYKKIADLYIDKKKKNVVITNPALKNVHSRDKLEEIIKTTKLTKKKKKELLDALDVAVSGGANDEREIIIEGKKITFPSNKYCIKPYKVDYPGSERECVYVTGRSGTGKSSWISDYLDSYKQKYPNNEIVIFSKLDKDEALDRHNPIRIDNQTLLENPIDNLEELANTCCIFDDTTSIPDKKINAAVQKVRDMILETGRHFNITCLVTSHVPMAGNLTKFPIREAHKIVTFPEGNEKPTEDILRTYCGFGKRGENELLEKMVSREHSRWGCLSRNIPAYVLFKRSAELL